MTRPASSKLNKHAGTCALVLDGDTVKLRLQAERIETRSVVHVDWVRFTCLLRNAPAPSADDLFPPALPPGTSWAPSVWDEQWAELRKAMLALPDPDYAASVQAKDLAVRVAVALGADFDVVPEVRKGHDFYRNRWSIACNGVEVAWVGYLASGDSPKQAAQAKTLHANIYGSATTFAEPGWNDRIADVCQECNGWLTRVDLALDFFEGISGGMERVKSDYEAGLCDSSGKRLKCNMVGDWSNGKGRSFYLGSKEAGMQTNLYEKGFQLYGEKDATNWMRAEARMGNKLRDLDLSILRRPQDWFAGISPWHAQLLREHELMQPAIPEKTRTRPRLAVETIEAETTRSVRWLNDVAAPSMALAFEHLGMDQFLSLVLHRKAPRRLQRFSAKQIQHAYARATDRVIKGADVGLVAA